MRVSKPMRDSEPWPLRTSLKYSPVSLNVSRFSWRSSCRRCSSRSSRLM